MKKENEGRKILTRRLFLFGGVQATLISILVGRMYYLQVVESEEYSLLADENRINLRLLPPPRGKILDRNGNELAGNQRNYRVIIIPEQTKSVNKTLNALRNIYPLGKYEISKILREVKKRKGFVPVTVAENLTWGEFSKVNVNAPDLPGIQPEIGESRFYPYGNAFAHVIGYVGIVDSKEMGDEPLLSLPGFRVGKVGVEKSFEKKLRGSAGVSRVEVNAYGRIIREINRKEGGSGDNINLTLDSKLQVYISKKLNNISASVVVMNIHSGDILALVSSPSYNPHSFNVGISNYEWQRLINNPKNPLLNKAIGGQYPPGSTFKMMVALAAIENGIISLNHKVTCRGSVELGNEKFHCWKSDGHGDMDLLSSIQQSCDVFFYEIAKRVGIDRIASMAKLFGLGEKTGILIPSERLGNIPTRKWKKDEFGKSWQLGETLHAGIGQGYVLTTPIQLALMMSRLCNGGLAINPRLIMNNDNQPNVETINVSKKSLDLILEGLSLVTNSPMGTAYKARITDPNWEIIGKTGTSQVRSISQIERETRVLKNEERPWEERDHALYVAAFPKKSLTYAASVVVEHGGSGSSTAAPIAKDIFEFMKSNIIKRKTQI